MYICACAYQHTHAHIFRKNRIKKNERSQDHKVSSWQAWECNLCLSDSNACSRILHYHLQFIIPYTHRVIVTLFSAFAHYHVLMLMLCHISLLIKLQYGYFEVQFTNEKNDFEKFIQGCIAGRNHSLKAKPCSLSSQVLTKLSFSFFPLSTVLLLVIY